MKPNAGAAGTAPGRRLGLGLLGASAGIALITVVARAVGFGRWIVFSRTVEGGCLADAYNTANLLPNVAFEVVVGGALSAAVVPVVAAARANGRRSGDAVVSALLTWALLLLVPLALLTALAAGPVVRVFLDPTGPCGPAAASAGSRLLLLFVPQLFCYAVAVVLGGALAAHHRFLAAALAPLASSVVVIGAYLAFAAVADGARDPAVVPDSALHALGLGTTLGVAALALSVAIPLRGAGIRVRPTLQFPPGVAGQVRALAAAGVTVLLTQQLALLIVSALANHRGVPGSFTSWTWAWAVFLLPHAVLALSITTVVFPHLAAGRAPAGLVTASTAAVLGAGALGALGLAAGAGPIAAAFLAGAEVGDERSLRAAIALLAPGLPAFGLMAHLSRVLYAAHRPRAVAAATSIGWAVVIGGALIAAAVLPRRDVVAGMALAHSVGFILAAGLLWTAARRIDWTGAGPDREPAHG